MNGQAMVRRLIADSRGRARLSPAVVDWIEHGYRRWSAGENPARAFGFIASRQDRFRRNQYLRRAVERMPTTWSNSHRADRIREVGKRLWPFCGDNEPPHALRSGWEYDVLSALEEAPLPSDRQLRKIVGSLRNECHESRVKLLSDNRDGPL